MISEDKMVHIVHLMLDGLEKAGVATFPKKDAAVHEAKKVCFAYMAKLSQIDEKVRTRIQSLKNPPPEFSSQWDILYGKYLDEEMRKLGG